MNRKWFCPSHFVLTHRISRLFAFHRWQGELKGKYGLFPASYVKPLEWTTGRNVSGHLSQPNAKRTLNLFFMIRESLRCCFKNFLSNQCPTSPHLLSYSLFHVDGNPSLHLHASLKHFVTSMLSFGHTFPRVWNASFTLSIYAVLDCICLPLFSFIFRGVVFWILILQRCQFYHPQISAH